MKEIILFEIKFKTFKTYSYQRVYSIFELFSNSYAMQVNIKQLMRDNLIGQVVGSFTSYSIDKVANVGCELVKSWIVNFKVTYILSWFFKPSMHKA